MVQVFRRVPMVLSRFFLYEPLIETSARSAISFRPLQRNSIDLSFRGVFGKRGENRIFMKNDNYIRQHYSVYLKFQVYTWNNTVYQLVMGNFK